MKWESTEQATTWVDIVKKNATSQIWIFELNWMSAFRFSSHLGTKLSEFLNSVIEGENLSWADKGEVKWVEEEHQILS